ncbi:hypothetical protein AAFN47_04250 [Hoeflea sp. CAU 1731]
MANGWRVFLHIVSAALMSAMAGAPASAGEFPDGEALEFVEGVCTGCHGASTITSSSGYDAQGWLDLTSTMIDLSGVPEERAQAMEYLALHFPPNRDRAPELRPGDALIRFTEWVTPTLGQRSRDPIEAEDGSIWWAGQWGNLIGRINPETGEMTEYFLPPGSMPHSVTLDASGNVWYTGNKNGTIGKFDPATEEITVFEMPDPEARDPHTAIFDGNGILWFTLQQSNMVGRLDPRSGDIRLVRMKTPGARPYGVKIDAGGSPWIACNGSNCLVRVDPETMALTEVKLPDPKTKVRRLDIDAYGNIWFVNSSLGRIGRLEPETGEITEWPSPSGPDSHPYALAVVDGIVWYNESRRRPDALVRFDPATEQFQSWAIPSGEVYAGIVRHMRPARDGGLLIHQSSTNRIIKVDIGPAVD